LKGIRVDVASNDSSTTSYKYLHLSNALLQCGFIDESLIYIDKSLAYNPQNPFSGYLRAYIIFAKNEDINEAKELLLQELAKDTTRFDIIQEVAKVCYSMRDYKSAYRYYTKFIELKERQQLDIYRTEDLKIAIVFSKMGMQEESEKYAKSFKEYADRDKSIYKSLFLSGYYAWRGDATKAIEQMKIFSEEDNFQYWILLLPKDPSNESIKDLPEFKKVMKDIETRFWNNHKKLRTKLEDEGLL
jgi:tetratricopeptide (TPR) repeat protein